MEDTQLWALELWELKDNDDTAKLKEMLNLSSDDEEESEEEEEQVKIEKPPKPIFSMTSDEIACYFGVLLKEIYKLEGVQKYKLWSKVQNGIVIKKATELKAYDKKAEEILPRDLYYGRGSGGANIGNKLKVVSAYLLNKHDVDHNMFAENIPPNYKPVHRNFDSYGDILEDTTKSKRTKPKAIRSNLQKRKADDFESSDHDSNDEGVKRKKSKPSEISSTLQTRVPVSSPLTPARPEFASTSFASIFQREEADESLGTPSAQDIGVEEAGDVGSDDEDSRIYKR